MELNAWVGSSGYSSSSANLTLSLDGGGTVQGFNTFSPRSSAATNSVSMEAFSAVNADLNLNGNWWGTTNPLEIEDLVFHGVDSSSLAIVDISTPLADELEFEASKSGNKIKLTANGGSGFVAYAGSTLIEVTVDGVVEDDVTVASNYLTLTFPKAGYSGEVTICVTNPGGQTGCATFSVPSGGGGGGGCGVIPVGGPPTAKQLTEQYLLLLLPVLFLLRRRVRGIRPVPADLHAA